MAGRALRTSHAREEPRVYLGGSAGAGVGNWGEHGDLQRLQRNVIAPLGGGEPATDCRNSGKSARAGFSGSAFLSGLSGLSTAEGRVFRPGRIFAEPGELRGGGTTRARLGGTGQWELLCGAGLASGART